MFIDPKKVKKQFEKSFDKYNSNAIIQKELAKKLVEEVSKIGINYDKILEIGSGTGLLSKQISKNIKFKEYYANDLIPKSKYYLDKILDKYEFIQGDAQKIKLNKKLNLIISNAVFQWFKDLKKTSKYYSSLLDKDGIIAFSTFTQDNFKEIKELTGISLEYKTKNQIVEDLKDNFEIIHISEYKNILKFSNPLELLAHIKNTGVNALSNKPLTFKEVKEFCQNYKAKYPEITLTYTPVIIVAKKI